MTIREGVEVILEVYQWLCTAIITILVLLLGWVGGEINITIYWHHVKEFINTVKKLL